MERNVAYVRESEELHAGARELMDRALALAGVLLQTRLCPARVTRAGRKAAGGVVAGPVPVAAAARDDD